MFDSHLYKNIFWNLYKKVLSWPSFIISLTKIIESGTRKLHSLLFGLA